MQNITFGFEAYLTLATLVAAICWILERFLWMPKRAKGDKSNWFTDLGRSLFPVLLFVLVLRSFVVEPFRIPSPSMAPTLLPGDFILVNKFAYGLRLPITHTEILDLGEPERGDIAVFRYPEAPSKDFIKRIVGLPGDTIMYKNHQLYINEEPVPNEKLGLYEGEGVPEHQHVMAYLEHLAKHDHKILKVQRENDVPRVASYVGYWARHEVLTELEKKNITVNNNGVIKWHVPEDMFFVMGDNRDHSLDSRFWGFVPESNLVGPAFLIWLSIDYEPLGLRFSRIGQVLE